MKKQYEWSENKAYVIIMIIAVTLAVGGVFGPIILLSFNLKTLSFLSFLLIPVSGLVTLISSFLSTRNKYTKQFIDKVQQQMDDAKSVDDLVKIREYIIAQAVDENNMIRLSYPGDIKRFIFTIDSQIAILNKQL